MLLLNNIKFSYSKHEVFDNLSLRFDEGKIYGLFGLNGAGKSTMLYLMSGILFPKSGKVEFEGYDMTKRNPEALSKLFLVPEEFELPKITFEKYIKLNAPFYPNFSRETLEKCLNGFKMDSNITLDKLSMGQKKKAFMCFALAANTPLLIMDEPTNGLDIPSKSQFRQVVSSCMDDKRTIIISTHQVADVQNLIDHIAIVNDKKCVFNQSIWEITNRLVFTSKENIDDANIVYAFDGLGGVSAVGVKTPDSPETPLDIALLFDAVLNDSQKFAEIFKDNSTEK